MSKNGTTHRWALEQIGTNVDVEFISCFKQKSDGFVKDEKQDDWLLIKQEDSKIEKNG